MRAIFRWVVQQHLQQRSRRINQSSQGAVLVDLWQTIERASHRDTTVAGTLGRATIETVSNFLTNDQRTMAIIEPPLQ